MNTRSLLTAGSVLALAGALAGFTTGRATAPTPEECITALAGADRTIALMADALTGAGASGPEQSSLEIEGITTELEAVDYSTSSAECRGRR